MPAMPEAPPSTAAASLSPAAQHHVGEMVKTLREEFGDQVPREQIDAVMADSVERLARGAEVDAFVPVLAYRYSRERLKSALRSAAPREETTWDVVFVSLSGAVAPSSPRR
jgi:hypothetical protein